MKQYLALFITSLLILTSCSSLNKNRTPAQVSNEEAISLKDVEIQSAVYSRSDKEVLLVVVDKDRTGSMVICDTPQTHNKGPVPLDKLSGCMRHRDTMFPANEETVQKINQGIPAAMDTEFQRRQQMEKQKAADSYDPRKSYITFVVGAASLSAAVSSGIQVIRKAPAVSARSNMTAGISVLAVAGVGITMFKEYVDNEWAKDRPIQPLNDSVKTQYASFIKRKKINEKYQSEIRQQVEDGWIEKQMFDILKSAIRTSVERATTA